MKLGQLLKPWLLDVPECEVLGLQNDSRQVKVGDLFFAYPGFEQDGRLFIADAIERGAKAVVYEASHAFEKIQFDDSIVALPFSNIAQHLAEIASRFYNHPSDQLNMVGVTGTNGKTTIAFQLAQANTLLGKTTAYLGTLGEGCIGHISPLNNTTPDTLLLNRLFSNYLHAGVKQVCMEVSSHALAQKRVEGVHFDQAIFTNLSHDHLDFHHTLDNYAQAKSLLFANPTLKWALINEDDPFSSRMKEAIVSSSCQVIGYGLEKNALVYPKKWKVDLSGTLLEIVSPWGKSKFSIKALGMFNIYNTLAIFSSLMASDFSLSQVSSIMEKLEAAPGRMQVVASDPCVIVDYAHTPDALANVLRTLQAVKKGRLLVVFGCGGDRDKSKRPMMGKIASELSDLSIITSDNPRHEEPDKIIDDIEKGMNQTHFREVDRKKAIEKALNLAQKNDIIVIAGKGHETYQQIGSERYPFSDEGIVRELV